MARGSLVLRSATTAAIRSASRGREAMKCASSGRANLITGLPACADRSRTVAGWSGPWCQRSLRECLRSHGGGGLVRAGGDEPLPEEAHGRQRGDLLRVGAGDCVHERRGLSVLGQSVQQLSERLVRDETAAGSAAFEQQGEVRPEVRLGPTRDDRVGELGGRVGARLQPGLDEVEGLAAVVVEGGSDTPDGAHAPVGDCVGGVGDEPSLGGDRCGGPPDQQGPVDAAP